MSVEEVLRDLPFDNIEELIEWSVNYLKDKEVKLKDVIDFFTIINGNQTTLYDITNLEDDYGEVVDMRFTLLYADYKIRLYGIANKVATFIIKDIEVI